MSLNDRHNKIILRHRYVFLAMVCVFGAAFAQPQTPWPHREFLGHYLSEPGEEVAPFMARLGSVLHAFSSSTGHEACGVIAQDATGRFGVSLFTDGVQRGCVMRWSQVPPGFTSIGQTLHSHPVASTIVLSDRDRAWNKRYGEIVHTRTLTIRPGFSPGDLRTGPGWLIDQNALHYHDGGLGRGHYVSRLSTPLPVPLAQ
jgi:hypothetical protein